MDRYIKIIVCLIISTVFLLGFRSQVFSEDIETGDSNSSTTVINDVNSTDRDCDCDETPTPTPITESSITPTEEVTPTITPTTKPSVTPTPTDKPSIGGPGDGLSDGKSDGRSDGLGGSSQEQVLGASTGPQVLGLSTTSSGNALPSALSLVLAFAFALLGYSFFNKKNA